MIQKIIAYGDPVLRKEAEDIEHGTDISELVADMFETMYHAQGVGLAGPQIGKALRIFVIDGAPMFDEEDGEEPELKDFKKVFVNATIEDEWGEEWGFEEGCLSIPTIRGEVFRPENLKIHYFDEHWNEHEEEIDGLRARIVQHEYDHIEGILFTDHLSSLKKRMLKKKLVNISKGVVDVSYRMKFPSK